MPITEADMDRVDRDLVADELAELAPADVEIEDLELAAEAIRDGVDAETLRLARGLACSMSADILRQILQVIIEAKDRSFACDILASTFGLAVREGKSDADLARHYGVSRQDILNEKKRMNEKIGVKFLTRRSKQHKAIYAQTNHRHQKAW